MKELLKELKALSDPTRLRIIMALRDEEVCVCHITEMMGLSISTISKHLSILYDAGIVEREKTSRWIFYKLDEKKLGTDKSITFDVIEKLKDEPLFAKDKSFLKNLLTQNIDSACIKR